MYLKNYNYDKCHNEIHKATKITIWVSLMVSTLVKPYVKENQRIPTREKNNGNKGRSILFQA